MRLLKQRFSESPDTLSPELHQIIAKWVLAVGRANDMHRERRTLEAIKALIEITGWSAEQVRTTMAKVADDLSPTPTPTP